MNGQRVMVKWTLLSGAIFHRKMLLTIAEDIIRMAWIKCRLPEEMELGKSDINR
jgi:hypothetical protein